MNDNFTKIVALIVVGGVAKALFAQPRTVVRSSVTPLRDAALSIAKDTAETAADTVTKRAR